MRTTLEIDDDVLSAAKALAASRNTTAGRVLSDLARQALTRSTEGRVKVRNGFRVLAPTGTAVTGDLVARLLDEDLR